MDLNIVFFVSIALFTIWFSRWLTDQRVAAIKAEFRSEALQANLEVLRDREALTEKANVALRQELEKREKQTAARDRIEAGALPFYTSTDKEQAQMDKVMHDKGEDFFDEVPGLGR